MSLSRHQRDSDGRPDFYNDDESKDSYGGNEFSDSNGAIHAQSPYEPRDFENMVSWDSVRFPLLVFLFERRISDRH